MELIDGGEYEIGTDEPVFEADGEAPARLVLLDDFYLDKYIWFPKIKFLFHED